MTKEPNLQLLKIPKHSQQSKVLPFMQLQNEVTLVTGNASLSDRQPKALATGYLEPYQSMLQVRKQVSTEVKLYLFVIFCMRGCLTLPDSHFKVKATL